MIWFGVLLLVASIISGYATMQTDLWAATTYPQGKTPKVKAAKRTAKKATKPRKKTKENTPANAKVDVP